MNINTSLRDPNLTLFPRNPSKHNIADDIRLLPVDVTAGLMFWSYSIDTYKPITVSSRRSLIFAVLL